jgi:hypothetical protein
LLKREPFAMVLLGDGAPARAVSVNDPLMPLPSEIVRLVPRPTDSVAQTVAAGLAATTAQTVVFAMAGRPPQPALLRLALEVRVHLPLAEPASN